MKLNFSLIKTPTLFVASIRKPLTKKLLTHFVIFKLQIDCS